MLRLLIVHHMPSPALQEMFEAAVSGARTDEIEGVEVVIRPALTAAAVDVLTANGILLGTPANIGYMSGRSALLRMMVVSVLEFFGYSVVVVRAAWQLQLPGRLVR